LTNNPRDAGGRKIAFRDSVKWIRVVQLGQYEYKTSHRESDEWHLVDIGSNRHKNIDLSSLQLQTWESQKVPMKTSKAADIRKQLAFIPSPYRAYYEQALPHLPQQETVAEEESEGEVSDMINRWQMCLATTIDVDKNEAPAPKKSSLQPCAVRKAGNHRKHVEIES